jgi:WD40 repeat protein
MVAFSPRGNMIAFGSTDVDLRNESGTKLLDLETGQCHMILCQDCETLAWRPASASASESDTDSLFIGGFDGVVTIWQVMKGADGNMVRMLWRSISGALVTDGALIRDVKGLSPLNRQLLEQQGSVESSMESPVSLPGESPMGLPMELPVGSAVELPVRHPYRAARVVNVMVSLAVLLCAVVART